MVCTFVINLVLLCGQIVQLILTLDSTKWDVYGGIASTDATGQENFLRGNKSE